MTHRIRSSVTLPLAAAALLGATAAIAQDREREFQFTDDGVTYTGTVTLSEDGTATVTDYGNLTEDQRETVDGFFEDFNENSEDRVAEREDREAEIDERLAEEDTSREELEAEAEETAEEVEEAVESGEPPEDAPDSAEDARDRVEDAVDDARESIGDAIGRDD